MPSLKTIGIVVALVIALGMVYISRATATLVTAGTIVFVLVFVVAGFYLMKKLKNTEATKDV